MSLHESYPETAIWETQVPLQYLGQTHSQYDPYLTWFATTADVSREVNDGRGPADFKISKGAKDKTLVEFKLASNSQLEKNLANQTKVYQKASDAKWAIKVIIYFSKREHDRVVDIIKEAKT